MAQYLMSVLNDMAGLATAEEMAAIDVFNEQLQADGQLFNVRDDAWDDELQLGDSGVVRPDGLQVVAGEGSLRERIDLAQVVKVDDGVGHLGHAEQLCYGPRQSGLP
jgi:hypothetical protein